MQENMLKNKTKKQSKTNQKVMVKKEAGQLRYNTICATANTVEEYTSIHFTEHSTRALTMYEL